MRLLVLLLVGLAGCATTTALKTVDSVAGLHVVKPAAQFHLSGRMSVRTPDQTFSGTVSWTRAAGEDTLLLSGPVGQGAAEIHRQDGQVALKLADGSQISDASDERLMERALGVRLPLDGLLYWLSGQPRPGVTFKAGLDQDGRIERLDQDGWHIEYSQFRRDGEHWRPGRIFANRGDTLEFRFALDRWEVR
ncbi:MAG: lipoprotein insertase outer membrane protein LolB [Parasulfuritortus sp.]|jgi:outer membrane lipoprotein LolB|nr:lipoprotein insertase outer membrane protein LolB [Parasulfuritortus sp.]